MTAVGNSAPGRWPVTDDSIRRVMEQMLVDGSWGRYHGPHCEALRNALANYHAVDHVHLCCSGTSAVELALRAAGVSSGDEVILAAYDYKANFTNVLTVGAQPVLVDTLPTRPVINPAELETAITPATRAIICSHLHGCLADGDEIAEIARKHKVTLIEDACQVPGASLADRRAGTIGDIGVLSFGGSKLLTAGRGGAVLTHDARLAQRIRLYTQRGNDAYPLSEMQAAVLLPQLHQLDERNRHRREAIRILTNHLSPTCPVRLLLDHQDHLTAFYKVAFLIRHPAQMNRNEFSERMRAHGVELDPGFPALHRIHAKKRFRTAGTLKNATNLSDRLMTLHHPVLLEGEDSIVRVATRLSSAPDQ